MNASMDSTESRNSGLFNRANAAFAFTFLAGGLALGYFLGRRSVRIPPMRHNTRVKLEKDKVVDQMDMEDIGEKKVFCRCWQSNKFPYCDGTHTRHNKETGDNVGPLIIQAAKKAAT